MRRLGLGIPRYHTGAGSVGMSDLRRLVRQYGRDVESVYPTGDYFKGGVYGSDVVFLIPFDEENNPNFTSCLDSSP